MVDNIHMFLGTNGFQNYVYDKLHDWNSRFQIIIVGVGHSSRLQFDVIMLPNMLDVKHEMSDAEFWSRCLISTGVRPNSLQILCIITSSYTILGHHHITGVVHPSFALKNFVEVDTESGRVPLRHRGRLFKLPQLYNNTNSPKTHGCEKLLWCVNITNLQICISSTWTLHWFNDIKLQRWIDAFQTYIGLQFWSVVPICYSCNTQKVGVWVDKSMLNESLAVCWVSTQKVSNANLCVCVCQHELDIKCVCLAFLRCWHYIKCA